MAAEGTGCQAGPSQQGQCPDLSSPPGCPALPPHASQEPAAAAHSPILEARTVVREAGAGGVDRLQLGEAWGYRGAAGQPAIAIATPRGHGRGVDQATLFFHL